MVGGHPQTLIERGAALERLGAGRVKANEVVEPVNHQLKLSPPRSRRLPTLQRVKRETREQNQRPGGQKEGDSGAQAPGRRLLLQHEENSSCCLETFRNEYPADLTSSIRTPASIHQRDPQRAATSKRWITPRILSRRCPRSLCPPSVSLSSVNGQPAAGTMTTWLKVAHKPKTKGRPTPRLGVKYLGQRAQM